MRKIKVLDKNEVHKGDITELDGGVSFSVTENGYGSLGFQYVGEQDIEHADVVQVIDEDLATVETVVSNDDYLTLDGTNDSIESGSQEIKEFRYPNIVGEITTSSAGDSYQYWQGFSETDTPDVVSYIDVGGLFDEIAIDKAFSMKFAFRTGPGSISGYIFMHQNFSIYVSGNAVSVGFSGGNTKSFTTTGNNYYRCVLTYDGTNFVLYYNSTLAVGTATPSYNLTEPYCTIGNYIQNMRFYNMFIRDRVLTAGEITTENASHTIVTTSDTILNYDNGVAQLPAVHTTWDGDLVAQEPEYGYALDPTHDGTVSGGVTIVGDSIVFDGTGGLQGAGVITSEYTVTYTLSMDSLAENYYLDNDSTSANRYLIVYVGGRFRFFAAGISVGERFPTGAITAGQEFTITFSAKSGSNYIYFNSNLVDSRTSAWTYVARDISVFRRFDNGLFFDGTVSKVLLHNRQLTYTETEVIHDGGTITDGLVLSYSGLNYTGTPTSPTTILNYVPYHYSFVTSGRFKLGANGSNSLDSQPIVTLPYARLYSHLDTNRIRLRYDLGGTTYDGTVSGGVTIDDGAIVFDGVNGSLDTGLALGGEYSVTFGVSVDDLLTGTDQYFYDNSVSTSGRNIAYYGFSQNRILFFSGGTFIFQIFNIRSTFTSGTVFYITVTSKSGSNIVYVNGSSVGSNTITWTAGAGLLAIGRRVSSTNYLEGNIPLLLVHNRIIDASEVATLHNGGQIKDGLVLSYSGLDYAGTPSTPTTIYDMSQARITEHVLGTNDTDWHYYRCIIEKVGTTWYNRFILDDNAEQVLESDDTPNVEYTTKAIIGEYDGGYFDGDVKGYYLATLNEEYNDLDDQLLESGNTLAFTDHDDVLVRDMNEGEGTTLSTTGLIDGATRASDDTAPFVKTYKRNVEYPIYYGQVTSIKPVLEEGKGKRTQVNCIGIQTTLNDKYYRLSDGTTTGDELLDPDQIVQNVLDQQDYHYLDYTGTQLLESQDYTRRHRCSRGNFTLSSPTATDPFGNTVYLINKLNNSVTQEISMEYRVPTTSSVGYIYRFWIKSLSSLGETISIDYNNDGTYFVQKTFTIDNKWQRVGVIASRSGGSGDIRFRIRASGSIYLSTLDLFRQSTSTLPDIGSYPLDISWSNIKSIQAFQNAITYSGAKTKRIPNKYIEFFDPDTAGTPDHYIIEEAHLSYIEKGVTSDELFNSVAMTYDSGTTDFIEDATSIDEYRRREIIVNADNINSEQTAEDYAQLYLEQVKDPKDYVKMTVTRAYPIGSLRVGDLVEVNGNTLGVRKGYITRIDMNDNTAIVYLDHYNGLGKSLSFLR